MGFLETYGTQDDRNSRFRRIATGGLGALVVIVLALASDHERVRPARSDDNISAWVFSERFVSRRLNLPAAAEFCGYDPASVSKTANDSWRVVCWVEERSAAGETRRSNFTALIHKHGDLWSLEKLTLAR